MEKTNKELYCLYSSPNIIRDQIKNPEVDRAWQRGKALPGFWWGNLRKRKPFGRRRSKWKDNIKMGLLKVGWGSMGWTYLAQHKYKWRALVNAVMNLRVP